MSKKPKVILFLGEKSKKKYYLIEQISPLVDIQILIWEKRRRKAKFRQFRRRAEKLGVMYPIGRILLAFYVKLFENKQRTNSKELQIIQKAQEPSGSIDQLDVNWINSKKVASALRRYQHDLVIVYGTSIIRKRVLALGRCFVNLHAGITPEYRGAHGGLWAVINQDFSRAGETLHLIDEGIDTGGIIQQQTIDVTKDDTMDTISAKQSLAGVEMLKEFIVKTPMPYSSVKTIEKKGAKSRLYYSPTLWDYWKFLKCIRGRV